MKFFDAREAAALTNIAKTTTKRALMQKLSAFARQVVRDNADRLITDSLRTNPRHIMDKRLQTHPAGAASLRHIQNDFKYI